MRSSRQGIGMLLLLAVLWPLAGCESASVATPTPVTITVVGSTAMRNVLRDLTEAYTQQHPNVIFSMRGGGSTVGEETVSRGEADLAASTLFASAVLTPAAALPQGTPQPAAGAAGSALVRTPVGIDGLAVIVHASNKVDALSLVQLRDLFSGQVLDWQALGSGVGEIQLVSREDGSGARLAFEQRVMGDEHVSLTAVVMPSSQDVVGFVDKNPNAIGYVSRSEVGVSGPAVKVLRVEDLLPTIGNVAEQRYPLITPLYLVTKGQPSPPVRQFLDFVLSPAGQSIVARYHAPLRR